MRVLTILVFLAIFAHAENASAQFSAQKDAQYLATLKAVMDYKINDEENIRDIEALRNNARFNQDLRKKLGKLSNARTKNSDNKRILDILEKAGKDIHNILN